MDEAFGFAVGAGSAGLDAQVFKAKAAQRCSVTVGGVTGAVVGHDRADGDSALGKPGDGATQERDRAAGGEIVEHLSVGEPGVVVDDDVYVLAAGESVSRPSRRP